MMEGTGGPLLDLLGRRAESGQPLRVGLIGAGKFGTMFLSQARDLKGLHVLGVADLSAERARLALSRSGWPEAQYSAAGPAEARDGLSTWLTEDAEALLRADGLEVVVEATGAPAAGIGHALGAIEQGRHVVMVNVEADRSSTEPNRRSRWRPWPTRPGCGRRHRVCRSHPVALMAWPMSAVPERMAASSSTRERSRSCPVWSATEGP